jgi:hypothetical protein
VAVAAAWIRAASPPRGSNGFPHGFDLTLFSVETFICASRKGRNKKLLATFPTLSDGSRMLDCPLVSVHFPKTSGWALRAELITTLGDTNVLLDYDCDPVDPVNPLWIDRQRFLDSRPRGLHPFKVVHGHFPIIKYDLLPRAFRIVMLRDPVDNLISIFYFWRSLFDSSYRGHALYELVKKQRFSLLEFAEIPSLRQLMSRSYFGGYDMRRFDIIGDYSRRAEYMAAVSDTIGMQLLPDRRENVTPLSEERGNVSNDTKTISRLRNLLRNDIMFYERHAGSPKASWLSRPVFVSKSVLHDSLVSCPSGV